MTRSLVEGYALLLALRLLGVVEGIQAADDVSTSFSALARLIVQ
ncbi:MAG: hypothetical protein QM706_01840 [Nitrospira sp.]